MQKRAISTTLLALAVACLLAGDALAQRRQRVDDRRDARSEPAEASKEQQPAESMSSEEATIDALGLFVYPAEEQSEEQQAKDERQCVEWAQGEVGDSPPEGAETETTGGAGSAEESGRERGGREGLRGAARGAAAGAVVDEVREPDLDDIDRDDLGDADSPEEARKNLDKAVEDDHSAAKVGAVAGAVAGRSRARGEQAATEQQQAQVAEQQSALANDAAADALRKAVKACLEARGYSVE